METCSLIISIFLICLCFAYVFVILAFTYGWVRLEKFVLSDKEPKTKVSIIIPARNEEQNITDIFYDLLKQSYPKNLFEIIVVDDFSADSTSRVVEDFCKKNENIRLIRLSGENCKHEDENYVRMREVNKCQVETPD
ncbi:MAG: glycosyltransferase, partial [Bacteroidales bacterium]|nr:glycosyltransferase [Bacteroidales bacterium]